MLQHPAAALLIMTAPMDGPTALLVGERLIDAFTEGGLSPDDASRSSYALMVQVLGFLALEVAEPRRSRRFPTSASGWPSGERPWSSSTPPTGR